MKLLYAIDFESWVFPEDNKFLGLTKEERKKMDNGYVLRSGYELLKLLERKKQKLTFFIIGQIYEWYPDLIKDIFLAGHEIAYHTYQHSILKDEEVLKEELRKGKDFIESYKIKGFQAPAIIFPEGGHKLLKEYGLEYSSSVYSGNKNIFMKDGIREIPVSVYNYFDNRIDDLDLPMQMNLKSLVKGIPFGSSYFMAVLGGNNIAKIIKRMEKRNKIFVNLFIHNWQIFPPKEANFPLRRNLLKQPSYLPYTKNIRKDFEYMLDEFEFCKFSNFLDL